MSIMNGDRAKELDGALQRSDWSEEFMESRLNLSLLFLPLHFVVSQNMFFQSSFKIFFPKYSTSDMTGETSRVGMEGQMNRKGLRRGVNDVMQEVRKEDVKRSAASPPSL